MRNKPNNTIASKNTKETHQKTEQKQLTINKKPCKKPTTQHFFSTNNKNPPKKRPIKHIARSVSLLRSFAGRECSHADAASAHGVPSAAAACFVVFFLFFSRFLFGCFGVEKPYKFFVCFLGCFGWFCWISKVFSRMRSEGFSFNFGSLRVELCSPVVVFVFATVRNRPQPSATVCNRSQPSATVRKCSNPVPMALPLGRAPKSDFSWTCRVSVCAAIPLWFA